MFNERCKNTIDNPAINLAPFEEFCKCGRLQVCAILHDKSFIYAVGYNNYVPHVNIFRRRLMCPSTHAEVSALKKIIDKRRDKTCKIKRLDMTILRKTNRNEYASSKPCKHCLQIMRSKLISQFINIRKVTYFDGHSFITEHLNDIENDYISSGWNHYYDST